MVPKILIPIVKSITSKVLFEYSHNCIIGLYRRGHPFVDKGVWYTVNGSPTTLKTIGQLCNIPADELTMLAIKYGNK